MAKVLIAYVQTNDGGDYGSDYKTIEFDVIDEKRLDDINKVMKDFFVKRWLDKPDLEKPEEWQDGDAALLEFRPFVVRPVRVVQSWELVRTNVSH